MKLIIDIPEEEYRNICLMSKDGIGMALYDWIANGTPLPKGHGRLIDVDRLKEDMQTMTEWNGDVFRCVTEKTIDYAPTIIEANY